MLIFRISSLILLWATLAAAQTYELSFVAWGDPQWGRSFTIASDSTEGEAIVAAINTGLNSNEASFTLVLGDLVDNPNDESYGVMDKVKGVLDKLDSTYYVLPGNHDTYDDQVTPVDSSMKAFLAAFTYPPSGTIGSIDGGYYFTEQSWVFIHLNSSDRTSSTIANRPYKDIPADTIGKYLNVENSKHKVVMSHVPWFHFFHPIYAGGGKDEILLDEQELTDSLNVHNSEIELFFAGHRDPFGMIMEDIDYRVSNSGHLNGYELIWVDAYDDGSYQITPMRASGTQ